MRTLDPHPPTPPLESAPFFRQLKATVTRIGGCVQQESNWRQLYSEATHFPTEILLVKNFQETKIHKTSTNRVLFLFQNEEKLANLGRCFRIFLDSLHSNNISFQFTAHTHHPVESAGYLKKTGQNRNQ